MSCHDTGSGVSILHDISENFTFCGHIQRGSCFIQQKDRLKTQAAIASEYAGKVF